VLLTCLVAAWMIVKRMIVGRMVRQKFEMVSLDFAGVTATNVLFLSNLGFLLLAYGAGSQPDIWSRYGLLFFALGLPVTAWTFPAIIKERPRLKIILAAAILAIFLFHTKDQFREAVACWREESAKTIIAAYLKDVYRIDPGLRIYCDEGNVRSLTGLPQERFLTAYNLPTDQAALLKRFDEAGVKYVVCTNWETTTLTRLFPDVRKGTVNDIFHPVTHAASKYSGLELWVYRFR
jgi:hypothetical protein